MRTRRAGTSGREAPQSFLGGPRQDLLPNLIGIGFPADANAPVDIVDEAGVGYRDSMGIALEVGEHPVRSARRQHGIDHPRRGVERGHDAALRIGNDREGGAAREGYAVRPVRAVERLEVLNAAEPGEGPAPRDKAAERGEPACAVAAQRAAGACTLEMEVLRERRASCLQDGGHAEGPTELVRVATQGQQDVGRRLKLPGVSHAEIPMGQGDERMGQR